VETAADHPHLIRKAKNMRDPAAAASGRGRSIRPPLRLAGLIALAAVAGCDIPTEPPAIDTRWVVPAEETRFGVAELLPGDVTLTPDSSAFVVNFLPVAFSTSLGSLCAACVAANGLTVPKPAFLGDFDSAIDFPPEVSSVTIVSGQVALAVWNRLNFDPIRPAAGVFGTITVRITDSADGDVLGTVVIDGTTTAMAPDTTLNRNLALQAGTVNGSLVATVEVNSPLGDPVTINTNLQVNVTATPTNVLVGAVAVDVGGRSVDLDPVSLDVEDVDAELTDRIVQGAFVLHVVNPFAIGAAFQLTIDGPTIAPIQKGVNIGAASTSTVSLAFTAAELQSFLGEPDVMLSGGAVVDAAAPIITVTPGQELILSGDLDLTIRIGG